MNAASRIGILCVGPILGMGGLVMVDHSTEFSASATSVQETFIEQPKDWVPFASDYKHVDETSGDVFVGRFYRGLDGSTRSESAPLGGKVGAISIKNIAQARFYIWSEKNGWTVQPMDIPNGGWVPFETSWRPNMRRLPDPIEGFEIIERDAGERLVYEAPALNLFVLAWTTTCKWDAKAQCGSWFTNVNVGAQPMELFLPPIGVPIAERPDKGGIIQSWAPQP